MSNFQTHSNQKKSPPNKPAIVNTTAEKLKKPEYSVDKSAKQASEKPSSIPKSRKS